MKHVYPTAAVLWDGVCEDFTHTPQSWDDVYALTAALPGRHACTPLNTGGASGYPPARVRAAARAVHLPSAVRAGQHTWIVSHSVPPCTLVRFTDGHTPSTDAAECAEADGALLALHAIVCAATQAGCVAVRGVCGTQHASGVQALARKHGDAVVCVSM